jgi:hypothetical protein
MRALQEQRKRDKCGNLWMGPNDRELKTPPGAESSPRLAVSMRKRL